MNRFLHKIVILLAAALVLASSCNKNGVRVIPRAKLAKIYAEMFVMDQWIQNKPGLRTIADTSLVYEPILEKYGFDSDDYQYTIERYMADPERYSRILRTTVSLLDKDLKALRKKQAEITLQEKLRKEIENFEITKFQFYDEFVTEDGLRNLSDSIDVVWDTTYNAFRFRRIPRTDTIYEGPRMIVKDTLAVSDSLAAVDTLQKNTLPSSPTAVSDTLQKKFAKLKPVHGNKVDTASRQTTRKVATPRQLAHPQRQPRPQKPAGSETPNDN